MDILVLNQDWLVEELRAAGHNVRTSGLSEHMEIGLETAHVHIDTVIGRAEGFNPDVIIFHDNSGPNVFAGLEETDIPVIFYSVDTHHHHAVHRFMAHTVDHTFVAQKDYIPMFSAVGAEAEWMPLWASRYVEASHDKQFGAVFVGNLNPELNPDRVWFFNAIQQFTPVLTKIGAWWEIFPFSEIVINQTVKGDLNFRVFEAMITGAMLLTEDSPNGLLELFQPEKHLVTYPRNCAQAAAEKIRYYTDNKKLAREIGMSGREEILKRHMPVHRAETILSTIRGLQKKHSPKKFFSAMTGYCILSLRSESIDTTVAVKGYVSALRTIELALKNGEPIDSQIACFCVFACFKYDQFLGGNAGQQMLSLLREAYSDEPVLKIAVLRNMLNQGHYELARALASNISAEPTNVTFEKSEYLVRMILEGNTFSL